MSRRRARAYRIAFHTGALLSLLLATLAGGVWIRTQFWSDEWSWVVDEKHDDGLYVHEFWNVSVGGHGWLRLGAWREVACRSDADTPQLPQSSRFLHRDDGPSLPPLLPPLTGRFFHEWGSQYGSKLLPRTSYFSTNYLRPALLSTRTHHHSLAALGSLATGQWSTPYDAGREWGLLFPLWPIVLVLAIWPACWELLYRRRLYLRARDRWRRQHHLCPTCAYDLRATPTRCPECGSPQSTPGQSAGSGSDRSAAPDPPLSPQSSALSTSPSPPP